MKEFTINKNISLRLKKKSTVIYVNGEEFIQCKLLLLEMPINDLVSLNEIQPLEEATGILSNQFKSLGLTRIGEIPPETMFWGHCSNLQVWAENNYNSRLLPIEMAFSLLKKLTEVGDPVAKEVFKEEITRRFKSGHPIVVEYLLLEGYLDYFSNEEIDGLFRITDLSSIKTFDFTRCIFEEIPKYLQKFVHLQELSSEENDLEKISGSIGKLTSLQKLNLK